MPPWLRNNYGFICVMLAFAVLMGYGVQQYGPWSDYAKQQQKHQQGDLTVTGQAPKGFRVAKVPSAEPSLYLFTQASAVYKATAKAPASHDLTVEIPLRAGINPKNGVLALASRAGNGKWQLQSAKVTVVKNGTAAQVTFPADTAAHAFGGSDMQPVSYQANLLGALGQQFGLVFLSFNDFKATFKQLLSGYINDTPAAQAPALECYNEAEAKDGGQYNVTWQGKNAKLVNWCLGLNKPNHRRYVEIGNPNGFPLLLKFTKGMTVHKNTAVQVAFEHIARIGTGSNSLVLFPRSKVEMNVGDLAALKLKATVAHTEYDGWAQGWHNADVAAQALVHIGAKWNPGKAPEVLRVLDKLMATADCTNAIMAADLGRTFKECFSEKLLRGIFPAAVATTLALLLDGVVFAGKIVDFIVSGTKGVVEQRNGGDQYWVRVEYSEPANSERLRECGYLASSTKYSTSSSLSCKEGFSVAFAFVQGHHDGGGKITSDSCKGFDQAGCDISDTWKCQYIQPGRTVIVCTSPQGRIEAYTADYAAD